MIPQEESVHDSAVLIHDRSGPGSPQSKYVRAANKPDEIPLSQSTRICCTCSGQQTHLEHRENVVHDPERRIAIVRGVGQALPPLQGIVSASLDQITQNAAGLGTVGLVGLAWGASHFYGSLDDAFARIFQDERRRGFLIRTARGMIVRPTLPCMRRRY